MHTPQQDFRPVAAARKCADRTLVQQCHQTTMACSNARRWGEAMSSGCFVTYLGSELQPVLSCWSLRACEQTSTLPSPTLIVIVDNFAQYIERDVNVHTESRWNPCHLQCVQPCAERQQHNPVSCASSAVWQRAVYTKQAMIARCQALKSSVASDAAASLRLILANVQCRSAHQYWNSRLHRILDSVRQAGRRHAFHESGLTPAGLRHFDACLECSAGAPPVGDGTGVLHSMLLQPRRTVQLVKRCSCSFSRMPSRCGGQSGHISCKAQPAILVVPGG